MVVARLKILSLAAFASLAAVAAHAADYPQPQPIIIQQPEFASAWYLRGDIGFSNQQVGSLFNENYNRFTSVDNIDKGFDAAPIFGLGVGYNVNDWFRFDVTGEYRARANFHGLDIGHTPPPGNPVTDWPDRYTGSKYEWTFLLNGYVDLGTWYNFTPFVGAGVGFTRNTITNFGDVNLAVGGDSHSSDASKWNFAWALHAGVAYKLTRNVTIELSYRYIDLGKATTGTMVDYTGSGTDTPFEFRHLTSNDVRLGLRFNLDSLYDSPQPVRYYAQAPAYAAPPVYTQPPVYPQQAPGYAPPPMYGR